MKKYSIFQLRIVTSDTPTDIHSQIFTKYFSFMIDT